MRRVYVGIDLTADGLTLAAIQRGRPSSHVTGMRREVLDGVLEISSRQPNVRHAQRFVTALKRGMETLAGREERFALSLPDRVGRIYLSEVDAPFKTHQEGIEVLKWQLKGNLPMAPGQVHLDYQVMEKRDDGRQRCIVVAIARPILEQYESLIDEAGLHAAVIDFHSLSLYNYYRPRLDLGAEFVLVSLEQGSLVFQYYSGGIMAYQRVRDCQPNPQAFFRELNRTLTEGYEKFAGMKRCPVHAHLDPDFGTEMRELLDGAFEREVRLLDAHLRKISAPSAQGLQPTGAVVAALGAAERLI